MARELITAEDAGAALRAARTIAVLGFNPDESRPAHYVPAYLRAQGYRVIPVNPVLAARGAAFEGEPARATLAEIAEPVDVVNVFRRPKAILAHLEDILAMSPLPGVVWLQQGIRHDEAAGRLVEAGINVVQDRCTLADHRRFRLGRAS